jgi:hemerythrin-like domain-containing protein
MPCGCRRPNGTGENAMSRVLEELRRDHRNMTKILAILDEQLRAFRDGRVPDFDLMQRAMDYSLDYPDLCHHPKEDLIFERLARCDPGARALVDRLAGEHREIAKATRQFADTLHMVADDFQVSRDRFVDIAEAFLALNRRHMREEERDLFPRAERALGDADWAEIDAAAVRKPDPVFGGTVEERYLALHERILQLSG